MDIKLEKKPWYIRYRYYLTGGLLFISFLIYVIVLSLGPREAASRCREYSDSGSERC